MKATIVNVAKSEAYSCVGFDTEVGSGRAIWKSASLPRVGRRYDIEIDIEEVIDFSENAHILGCLRFGMSCDEYSLMLTGMVEDQDDDGMTYLRISPDCLIMVEANEYGLKGKCLELSVPVRSVALTPIGV